MNQYFHLFSFCIPVKGSKKAVVCDLQRNIVQPIPLSLYDILTTDDKSVETSEDFAKAYGEKEKQQIKEYITFLYNNQFGYTSESPITHNRLDLSKYEESRCITNAIVDFDTESKHSLTQIIPQLNELGCFVLEMRFFYPVSIQKMEEELSSIHLSTLRSLEIHLEFSDDFVLDKILDIKKKFPIIKKMTVSGSQEDTVYNGEDIIIIFTTETVQDEHSCGVINELYCIAETKLFLESIHFNSCLNKKISVDKRGLIKNCPSMRESFGSIFTTKLTDVLQNDSFCKLWKINKDQIDVCSDCELRYVCQDCRAYIVDNTNIYSKPQKCAYNPYE